jgi:hypothetical protein
MWARINKEKRQRIKDAAASMPPQLRSSRYIRYRDNIGYPRYGESYNIGDNQYSSKNKLYCPINRLLESVTLLIQREWQEALQIIQASECTWPRVRGRQRSVLPGISNRNHIAGLEETGRGAKNRRRAARIDEVLWPGAREKRCLLLARVWPGQYHRGRHTRSASRDSSS